MDKRSTYLLNRYYDVDNDINCNYDKLVKNNYSKTSIEYADNLLLIMRCELLMGKNNYLKKYFDEVLDIYINNEDLVGQFFILSIYGITCRESGDVDEAIEVFNKAYRISYELNDFSLIVSGLINHICVDENVMQSEEVLNVFKDAKKYLSGIKNQKILAAYHLSYGYMLFQNKNYTEAMNHFKSALEYYLDAYDNENSPNTIAAKINIAATHIELQNYDEAIEILEAAHKVATYMKNSPIYIGGLKDLSKAYKSINNYKKAYEYLELAGNLSEEINTKLSINSEKLKDYLSAEFQESKDKMILSNLELKKKTLELEENINYLNLISELGKKLTSTNDENKIFSLIADTIYSNIEADFIGLFLVDEEKRNISLKYTINQDKKKWSFIEIGFDDQTSISAYCAREREDVLINDLDKEAYKYVTKIVHTEPSGMSKTNQNVDDPINSIIYCQIIDENDLIGLLTIQSENKNSYDDRIFKTVKSIAAYVSIAVSNAKNSRLLNEKSKELKKLSYMDTLTGLENRRSFIEYNDYLKTVSDDYDSIAFIVADMNHLKLINDNTGHLEGDRYLLAISKVLLECSKGYRIFRLSGDEFGMFILNPEENEVQNYIEKVKNMCERKEYSPYPLSLAMGYSIRKDFDLKALFNNAEINMYEDKSNYYNDKNINRRFINEKDK